MRCRSLSDSSSSKLSLINNIFYNNHATDDRGVYNCGKYSTVTNNWYGYNDVNFDDAYLLEWHRIGSNDKITDSNSLRIVLSANETEVFYSSVKLTLKFVCSDKTEFTGKLTNWSVNFSSNNKGEFSDLQIGDNEATVIFTPQAGEHVVSAKVHGQEVTINLSHAGDFTWLQQQIDATPSGGVLTLNRSLTYTSEVDNDLVNGVEITKPIVINGNGHKIDALSTARIFSIHCDDVEINNITFVNGDTFDDSNDGGAICIDNVKNVNVVNSKFINNSAGKYGGAIAVINGSNIKIINSQFMDNSAPQGGAIMTGADNAIIDGCEFINNIAIGYMLYGGGGAVSNSGNNLTVSNSVFLNNKAESNSLEYNISDNKLVLTLDGLENYINAIYSSNEIEFLNVTYWDGAVTTGNNPVYSINSSGQNIALEIFNSNNYLVKKVTLITDIDGQVEYDFSNLENGNYTFIATHFDDS